MRNQMRGGAVVLVLFLLIGCGGDGGSSLSDLAPQVKTFLTDAPFEDLDNFVLTISSLTLVNENGAEVVLFSGGTIQEDLLDLVMIQQLISSATVVPGIYAGMNMVVDNISADANGIPQTVSLDGGGSFPATIQILFEKSIVLLPGSQVMIVLDFDVEDSVEDGGGNSIVVQPVIFAKVRTKHVDLGDFEGIVQSINTANGTFTVMIMESSGPGSEEAVGIITVQVSSDTTFEADDNTTTTGTAGLSFISVGMEVEIEGSFNGSVVEADVVEAEEADGGASGLEFEGVVTSTSIDGPGGATDTATLKILEVERDAGGDLTGLTSVTVDLETGSPLYQADLGSNPNVFDVEVGEKLEVQGVFSGGQVQASVVCLDKTRFKGNITALGSNSVTLSPLTAERTSIGGLTSRTFDVTGTTVITVDDVLPIELSDLALGHIVKVKAARDVDADQWVAVEIEREGADFDGLRSDISSISSASFVMTADGTELGLGNPVTLTVLVIAETEIVLELNNQEIGVPVSDIADVLNSQPLTAKIKVEGILDGSGNLIATEIVIDP